MTIEKITVAILILEFIVKENISSLARAECSLYFISQTKLKDF